MDPSFDALLEHVERAAAAVRAFGYLNTLRSEADGSASGYEIRFQPNPLYRLWDGHRFGYSRRFSDGAAARAWLDSVTAEAGRCADRLDDGDAVFLDALLAAAEVRGTTP